MGGGFGWPWAVAAVAAVCLLGWMLTRSSGEAGQVEQSLEQDSPTTTTRPRSSTSRRPGTTTTRPTAGFVEVEGIEAGLPVLGEPVGLTVFVAGSALYAIDLDTGVYAAFDVSEAPMLATDEWLLVRDDNGVMAVIPRADPTMSPRAVAGDAWFRMVTTDGPDHVWAMDYTESDGTQQWISVSLADGSIRTVLDAVGFGGGSGEPVVASTVSGGVFVMNDDREGYRRIADGSPIAASDDMVLVRSCESPIASSCRAYWIDRTSGAEIDRFAPPLTPFWWGVWASPSGGFLLIESDSGLTLWDVERSIEVVVVPNGQAGSPVGFSPEGRFAAYPGSTAKQLIIYDSLTGAEHQLSLPGNTYTIQGIAVTSRGIAFGPTVGPGADE